jgi:hypothetical protein
MNEPMPNADRQMMRIVALTLVLGAVLRILLVDRFPFEQDELYTEIESRLLTDSPLKPGIQARPVYYLLQHVLLGIWPASHASMRALPVLFGIAGTIVTWSLARRVFGNLAGVSAAILVVLSGWQLYVSTMARYWSLDYLLAALFFLWLFESYRRDSRQSYLIALAALLLGTATHPTFLFAAAGAAAGVSLVRDDGRIGLRWPTRRAWTYLWLPFVAALVVAYIALKLTQSDSSLRNWSGRGWSATAALIPAIVEWATPTLCVAGALGAFVCLAQKSDPSRVRWGGMAVGAFVVSTLALIVSSFRTDVYVDYAVPILPLLIVSTAGLVGLAAERMRGHAGRFVALALAVVVAGILPSTVSFLSDGNRFDYRPALARIRADGPATAVLSTPIILQRHYAPSLRGIELRPSQQLLDSALTANGDLWAIIPVRRNGVWLDRDGVIESWVPKHCELIAAYQRTRFDFRFYRTELHRCSRDRRGSV